MSAATLTRPVPPTPPPTDDRAARRFLRAYGVTMLAMVAGVVAVQVGFQAIDDHRWAMAGAVVVGWAAAVGGALRVCGWRLGPVAVVTGAPAVVLALPASAGWLTPDAVALWGPVTTVLAVALVVGRAG